MNNAQKKKSNLVLIMLITLPFALAAMMWSILPSGYRYCREGQQKEVSVSSRWHPLQPAIHQSIELIKH